MENNQKLITNPLRADTDEKKRATCDRLFEAWKAHPELRLGQFLSCSLRTGTSIFYVEDANLIADCEAFSRGLNRETHRT